MIRLMEVEFRQTMVKDLKQYYYAIRGSAPSDLNSSEGLGLQPFYIFLNSELNE